MPPLPSTPSENTGPGGLDPLTWEAPYAIARALRSRLSGHPIEELSLETLYHWVLDLPEFDDDPDLANDGILMAIFRELYEEMNPL